MAPLRKISIQTATVCALFLGALPAHADLTPLTTITLGTDTEQYSVTNTATQASDFLWYIAGAADTPDFAFSFNGTMDVDPVLSYNFQIINRTSKPLAVSYHASVPVIGGPWSEATATVSVAAVGSLFGPGSIAPTGTFLQTAAGSGPFYDLGVGAGGGCSFVKGVSGPCYAADATREFAPLSFHTLAIDVNFILAGRGSGATVNGSVEVESVPEPGGNVTRGIVLLVLGGVGIGLAVQRRVGRLRGLRRLF